MTKAWKITISIVASILILIMGFLAVYFLCPWNKEFFDNAKKEFSIPGLDTTFVPQGFSKIEGKEQYLISGYMGDSSPSRFYVIDKQTGDTLKYFTLDIDGIYYKGHAGGIVSYGSSVWVVGDGNCYKFALSDIENVENGKNITVKSWFELGDKHYNNADFVYAHSGNLFIGEFYKEKEYETSKKNHFETRSGETNKAIVFGYTIDEQEKIGLDDLIPDVVISIKDKCQGMAITSDGTFVLSTSYSIFDSNIYLFKNVFEEEPNSTYEYGIYKIPLWFLYTLIVPTNRAWR